VKGRDFYDLLWYLGQNTPINLSYLESKMRDGKTWEKTRKITQEDLLLMLEARIKTIDFKKAAMDVASLIKDPIEVQSWNQEMFLAAIKNIKMIS